LETAQPRTNKLEDRTIESIYTEVQSGKAGKKTKLRRDARVSKGSQKEDIT
jgi:hypothetical protein